jgi:hypothetical protein
MLPDPTNRQQAEDLAIRMAITRLRTPPNGEPAALAERCARLGLPPPGVDGTLQIPFLGGTLTLQPDTFEAVRAGTGKPVKPVERLLALHYLCCEVAVAAEQRWIAFRDFPGGAFYWEPFCSRSVRPLLQAIGNDPAKLRARLPRFAATIEAEPADALAARITAVGRIEVLLVYRPGDQEFPASADVLFDACARRVFCAEDAAILASRICLGLL